MTSITTPGGASGAPALQPLAHGLGPRLQLWLVDLDDYAAQYGLAGLPPDEQQRAARMAFAHLARRSLASRHALRRVLAATLARSPQDLQIVADRFGKPHLADASGLHFSLSHRDRTALIGVHSECPLGVDVEIPGTLADLEALAEACFSPGEQAAWARLEGAARQRFFFTCWTRKEACVKALGVGLSAPLPAIDVGGEPGPRSTRLALAPGEVAVEVHSVAAPATAAHLVLACAWTDSAAVQRAHAAWG
ncbi:MAG TPA: 4'-phosphopantetheinyl transferase superfamily protein [Ideonella sp.]|nr:4'-phosphopantetheinyl transferase superfamily protein [Ideonella sp.]